MNKIKNTKKKNATRLGSERKSEKPVLYGNDYVINLCYYN